MRNLASKVRHQRPPSSKQTSNQQSDRLDFGNGVGGEKTTNGNLQNAAGKSTAGEKSGLLIDTDSELEEGEIQSEVDTNDEDSKQAVKRRGKINVEKTKSDSHKLKSCSDFALSASSHQLAQNGPKKSKNKREVESKVNVGSDESEISKCGQSIYSSGEQSSETDKFKSSSDLMSSENRTSDIDSVEESDEGEIYSGSDENVAYSYKDNMDDLDIEDLCVLGQTTTESELDDTLVENQSMGSPQKRKRSTGEETMVITINNENCLVNEGQCPQYKKPRIENDIGDGNDKLNVEKDSGKYRGVKSGDVRSSTYSEKTGLEIHIGEEHDSPGTQELEIIDDLGGDEDLDGDADSIGDCRDYNGDFESDEDLDDNEIYAWLEEGIGKRASTEEDGGHMQREKVVLKERGHDPFELLPEGWVLVTHNSGMPVYLHKQSRVCTLSKPYFLGPGSVRKHDIPVSAIPCLHYQKEKEREQSQNQEKGEITQENGTQENRVDSASNKDSAEINKDDGEKSADVCSKPEGATMDVTSEPEKADDQNNDSSLTVPPVKIEYAKERIKQNSLSVSEVRKYCERLFEFKTITVKKFKTWKDRRRHLNTIKRQSRPALPSNTKLITCTVPQEKGGDKPKRKEFVLNPTGKSYVCILHEYAQHTLRVQPRYVFRELENAQNPYSATVVINDVDYGRGYASSKKNAKMEAAKATLSILIPEMTKVIEEQAQDFEDLSFFDEIKIEDPRVYELCNKVGQPGPYQILLECLKRNYGMGDTHCKIDVKTLKHQKSEYTLTVGKHSVTVVCKNKREGKQRAAQAMLQQLHPHIFTLGALLRLYGRSSWKSVKEKKKEEHSITELQSHARSKRPNTALLEKLKEEMIKLKTQKDAIKSRGKFRVDSHSLPGNVIGLDL